MTLVDKIKALLLQLRQLHIMHYRAFSEVEAVIPYKKALDVEQQIIKLSNPKVKKLDWDSWDKGLVQNRNPPLYECVEGEKGWTPWIADSRTLDDGEFTLEEAKAICQKHYEDLVLSGLEEC